MHAVGKTKRIDTLEGMAVTTVFCCLSCRKLPEPICLELRRNKHFCWDAMFPYFMHIHEERRKLYLASNQIGFDQNQPTMNQAIKSEPLNWILAQSDRNFELFYQTYIKPE